MATIVDIAMHKISPPSGPAGTSPLRRPDSVRRTASIDVTWPEGAKSTARYDCRSRDIYTPPTGGTPLILGEDRLAVAISAEGRIESIASVPARPQLDRLLGKGHGDNLRRLIDELLPAERDAGSGLYLLLDDLPVFSKISIWVWVFLERDRKATPEEEKNRAQIRASMEGICSGFATGSGALKGIEPNLPPPVVSLHNPEDLPGFHALAQPEGISMRRARRIDVWREECICIDAAYQDSATIPSGARVGIHEYGLEATIAPGTLALRSVSAQPHILPYKECQGGPQHIGRLLGTPLRELRKTVTKELRGDAGCTHLNDTLRALAEVPALVAGLDT